MCAGIKPCRPAALCSVVGRSTSVVRRIDFLSILLDAGRDKSAFRDYNAMFELDTEEAAADSAIGRLQSRQLRASIGAPVHRTDRYVQ